MTKHFKYLRYVLKHKYFVFRAGLKTGAPLWRLIIHDYSKFSRAEWTPYVNSFFSGRAGVEDKTSDDLAFKKAFEHHWQHNPHHWEYWCNSINYEFTDAIPMPVEFAREMVADWLGAGRGITGSWDLTDWYEKNKDRQILHPLTKATVNNLLEKVDYGRDL